MFAFKERLNKLDAIKQTRLDHEQNIRLQNLAKDARETAEKQKQISQNVSQELQIIVAESQMAMRQLDDLLSKYGQLETEDPTLNYVELRDATNLLITEANEQKIILDKSSLEINELIKKIKEFKIPDEKDIETESQDIETTVNSLNAKVCGL